MRGRSSVQGKEGRPEADINDTGNGERLFRVSGIVLEFLNGRERKTEAKSEKGDVADFRVPLICPLMSRQHQALDRGTHVPKGLAV